MTVEQFENAMIDHINSERFKELHCLIEYDMERLKGVCDEFLEDCLERHPEILDDIESAVIEHTPDGVNLRYRGEIVGMMKWGKSI